MDGYCMDAVTRAMQEQLPRPESKIAIYGNINGLNCSGYAVLIVWSC